MPSAQVLESKKARAAVVTDLIKNSSAGVLVDYRGIPLRKILSSERSSEKQV